MSGQAQLVVHLDLERYDRRRVDGMWMRDEERAGQHDGRVGQAAGNRKREL